MDSLKNRPSVEPLHGCVVKTGFRKTTATSSSGPTKDIGVTPDVAGLKSFNAGWWEGGLCVGRSGGVWGFPAHSSSHTAVMAYLPWPRDSLTRERSERGQA